MKGAIPVRWITLAEARALYPSPSECECVHCALTRGPQWPGESVGDFRTYIGVDMPGRIVDDVRPDQRGGE